MDGILYKALIKYFKSNKNVVIRFYVLNVKYTNIGYHVRTISSMFRLFETIHLHN